MFKRTPAELKGFGGEKKKYCRFPRAQPPSLFRKWRTRTRSLPRAGHGHSPTSPNRAWKDLWKWQNIPKSIVCVWGNKRERVGASSLTHFYKMKGRASYISLPPSHSALTFSDASVSMETLQCWFKKKGLFSICYLYFILPIIAFSCVCILILWMTGSLTSYWAVLCGHLWRSLIGFFLLVHFKGVTLSLLHINYKEKILCRLSLLCYKKKIDVILLLTPLSLIYFPYGLAQFFVGSLICMFLDQSFWLTPTASAQQFEAEGSWQTQKGFWDMQPYEFFIYLPPPTLASSLELCVLFLCHRRALSPAHTKLAHLLLL